MVLFRLAVLAGIILQIIAPLYLECGAVSNIELVQQHDQTLLGKMFPISCFLTHVESLEAVIAHPYTVRLDAISNNCFSVFRWPLVVAISSSTEQSNVPFTIILSTSSKPSSTMSHLYLARKSTHLPQYNESRKDSCAYQSIYIFASTECVCFERQSLVFHLIRAGYQQFSGTNREHTQPCQPKLVSPNTFLAICWEGLFRQNSNNQPTRQTSG